MVRAASRSEQRPEDAVGTGRRRRGSGEPVGVADARTAETRHEPARSTKVLSRSRVSDGRPSNGATTRGRSAMKAAKMSRPCSACVARRKAERGAGFNEGVSLKVWNISIERQADADQELDVRRVREERTEREQVCRWLLRPLYPRQAAAPADRRRTTLRTKTARRTGARPALRAVARLESSRSAPMFASSRPSVSRVAR